MNWIDKYQFINHTPGGRVFPDIDCWGLVRIIYFDRLHVQLPEFVDFSQADMTTPADGLIADHLFQEIEEPEDFCVVCYYRKKILFHVGVYYDGYLLHTTQMHGFRRQKLDTFYPSCSRRYYRYAGKCLFTSGSDTSD